MFYIIAITSSSCYLTTIIYPNPNSTDLLKVQTPLKKYTVSIISAEGRVIKMYDNRTGSIVANIAGLSRCIYTIKITGKGETVTNQFVKN